MLLAFKGKTRTRCMADVVPALCPIILGSTRGLVSYILKQLLRSESIDNDGDGLELSGMEGIALSRSFILCSASRGPRVR